jgi:glycosyltransferase involved in cell wall biosynthesis
VNPLAGKSLAIATHVFGSGPADALEQYARERADAVLVVRHAFSYAREVESVVRRWEHGVLVHERRLPWHRRIPEPITWTKDVVLDAFWGARTPGLIDIFVGIDSLNAAAGLALRRARKIRRVVFWTIDYVPERFDNPVLNRIYHRFDRLCVRRSDETWNVSPRIDPARRERGVEGRQRVVPIGANVRPARPAKEPPQLIFVGHLLEKQGVQLALRALPRIRGEVPGVRLLVIGDGPYREALESLAAECGVERAVEFAGYIESHEEVEERIGESVIGLAPYEPRIASFTEFADPGKIKNYLAAGIPVITTEIVHSAADLAAEGAAVVIPYDEDALAAALVGVLSDAQRQKELRASARRVGTSADWTSVFDRALAGLPE